MSTPDRKKARLDAGATAFSQAAVENLQCPITSALFVRPVCAEDGRTYEKAAIERWLSSKQRSPLTNEPMGKRLMDSMTTRALVESAVENGAVDDDAAVTWHLESAKAKATGLLPGSIKEHLLRADALSPSKEIKLMLKATELKSRMADLESEKQALLAEKQALLAESANAATEEIAAILGEAAPVVPESIGRRSHRMSALPPNILSAMEVVDNFSANTWPPVPATVRAQGHVAAIQRAQQQAAIRRAQQQETAAMRAQAQETEAAVRRAANAVALQQETAATRAQAQEREAVVRRNLNALSALGLWPEPTPSYPS